MAKRFRQLGYGPIQAIGESIKGELQRALIVRSVTEKLLKQVGNEFGLHAVIHVKAGGKRATQYFLDASSKPNTSEVIGVAHFNRRLDAATQDERASLPVTILKSIEFNPTDMGELTRSSNLCEREDEFVLKRLTTLPFGILHPCVVDYK
jgi:hypothetical protein